MAKPIGSLLFILFPLLIFNFGAHLRFAEGGSVNQKLQTWCIAKYTANNTELINAIQYACTYIGDCSFINAGGSCFYPNNLIGHASAVMNKYYAKNGKNAQNCNFVGSALTVITNPSYGSCKFE